MSPQHEQPSGFERYWDEIDRELAQFPARPVLEPMPRQSTDFATVYFARITSIGPYRIGGYLSIPNGQGPFPALMTTPGYGSVNHVPNYNDRMRYVVLTLFHRGQRLVDQPFAARYPGLLTQGIASPETYIFRDVLADCIRGAEFLLDRPEVDKARVAISGNDLALITAARRSGFSFVSVSGLLFHRMMEVREQSDAYPVEEVNDYLRAHPDQTEAVAHTLSFFDPVHHVSRIKATTLLSVGDQGKVGGPEWVEALSEAHGGPVEHYHQSHEGGTDNDWTDAWLAERLGTEPMSRFRRDVA